jgi:tetratricopeptide (TPR) repeat protein
LEYLDRAINGHAGNTGYKLEYRFHYLLGTIRLGKFSNPCPDVMNLPEAERAFLAAAKYAIRDHPREAACAYLGAGWTAYCQGDMESARQFTQQAIMLDSRLAEAHFQVAKILMHVDDPAGSLPALRRAIELDRNYSIKAAADDDFKRHEGEVAILVNTLRQEAREKTQEALAATQLLAIETEGRQVQGLLLTRFVEVTPAKCTLDEALRAARRDTYYGHLDALSLCEQARLAFNKAVEDYGKALAIHLASERAKLQQEIYQVDSRISKIRQQPWHGGWIGLACFGSIIFFILGWTHCSSVHEANNRQEELRRDAINRAFAELRRKGYDPNTTTVEKARELGFKTEDLPPADTGDNAFFTWLLWFFGGSALTIAISVIGADQTKKTMIAPLEKEKSRLQQKDLEIQQIRAP